MENKYNFEDFFDIEEIQKIQDLFAKATGVASIITTPEGVPITTQSGFSRFCKKVRSVQCRKNWTLKIVHRMHTMHVKKCG